MCLMICRRILLISVYPSFRSIDPRSLDDKPVVWLRASQGLFIDLWRNPHVSHLLCHFGFNTVDETYAQLARLLLSAPHGELAQALSLTLASMQLAGKLVIGLQVRNSVYIYVHMDTRE